MVVSCRAFSPSQPIFMPASTINIFSVLWTLLLHLDPHSHQSLLACIVMFGLTAEVVNTVKRASRAAYKRQHGGPAAESPNPFASEVSMTGRSDTLKGDGKQMAPLRKCGRAYHLWTEEKRLPIQFQSEGHLNESIVVKLPSIVVS